MGVRATTDETRSTESPSLLNSIAPSGSPSEMINSDYGDHLPPDKSPSIGGEDLAQPGSDYDNVTQSDEEAKLPKEMETASDE
ncbi:unnamed protein product [Echinostoma caproni]|uniref:Uncharacterized protein n=1 Tax=Echinostoma caproni TaxID=27848 RepID=A0A3P8J6U1_9TREM|nr:unnamed protein product [Echinostoma caproni]